MDKKKKALSISKIPILEVPSEEANDIRKRMMIQKLFQGNLETKRTLPVPVSSVLAQVKSFLPKLKDANEQLAKADKVEEIGITVPPDTQSYIEMNLQLYEASSDSDSDSDGGEVGQISWRTSDNHKTQPVPPKQLIVDITDQQNSSEVTDNAKLD